MAVDKIGIHRGVYNLSLLNNSLTWSAVVAKGAGGGAAARIYISFVRYTQVDVMER